MAVNAPEPGVAAPYLHWRVSPAQAGATFEVERRTLERRWFFGYYWSTTSWTGTTTITDCASAGQCSSTGDLDPDPGEFQITHVGASHRIPSDSTTTRYEYRVRAIDAPNGRFWESTEWVPSTADSRPGGIGDLGTFRLGSYAAATCTSGTFYSLSTTGVVNEVTRSGSSATIAQFGQFTDVGNSAQMNAFGIGIGGTAMYAVERPSASSTAIAAIHRYTVANGWQRISYSGSAVDTGAVLGAVNLADGRYYFGGYRTAGSATTFQLLAFDPATSSVSLRGSFTTSMNANSNGDMAFDLLGNLYVVQSLTDGDTRIYTIAASAVAAGGTMPVTSTPAFQGLSGTNGVAFEGDGSLYLGTGSTVRIYDPSTVALRPGNVTTALPSSGDLASCLSPATLTVRKDVADRVAQTDQFTLTALRGTTSLGTATTTGTANGVQPTVLGPLNVLAGQSYTVQETISANAGSYTSSYTCVDATGATIASGDGRSGAVTIPNRTGANVVCTFRNAPLMAAVVVRKVTEDAVGVEAPGAGWRLTATTTSTTGSVAATPAATQTADAQGEASWNLRFGSASARASIAVSETQQAGYAFSRGSCSITTISGSTSNVPLPNAQGATLTGIAPGSSVECEIVNRVLPTSLTLAKSVPFGAQAATSWHLSATGPQSARPGPTGLTGSAAATAEISTGVAYRLAEIGTSAAATALYVQTGAWACVDELGASIAVTEAGDVTVSRAGAHVTCTVTNQTARLTLIKTVVNDHGGTLGAEDFTITATPASDPAVSGLAAFTVNGVDTVTTANTRELRPGHAYALTEDMGEYAYLGQSIQRYTGPVDATAAQLAAATNWQTITAAQAATVTVSAGQHAIYRFVNDDAPALSLPLTGGIGADTHLLGGAGVLLLGLLAAAVLLVRTRIRSSREGRLT